MTTRQPHKHAELIKAWADGNSIQVCVGPEEWWDEANPEWHPLVKYRIKPEPKPDLRVFYFATKENGAQLSAALYSHNLVLTFDGETGKLKSAEVI